MSCYTNDSLALGRTYTQARNQFWDTGGGDFSEGAQIF